MTDRVAIKTAPDSYVPHSPHSRQARTSALCPESGSAPDQGSRGAGANGFATSCKRLSGDSAPAPALPNLQRSGHGSSVTQIGVHE